MPSAPFDAISGLQQFSRAAHAAKRAYDAINYESAARKRQKVYDRLMDSDPDTSSRLDYSFGGDYKRARVVGYSKAKRLPSTMVRSYRARRPRFTRRRTGTRRRFLRKRRGIPSAIGPNRIVRRFKFTDYQALTCTSGALGIVDVSANSLYDPLRSYSTQQPYGLDQWSNFYNKYCVIGVKIKVDFHNNGTPTLKCGVTALAPNQSASLGSYEAYMEAPRTTHCTLSSDVDHGTVVNKMSVKKMLNVKNLLDNEGAVAAFSADPTLVPKFHIWAQPLDQTSTGSAQAVISLEFIAVLLDYKYPTRS